MYNSAKPYKKKLLQGIEKTWKSDYVKVERGLYPIIIRKYNFLEVQHTDGIGTKGIYHWIAKSYKNAVIDAMAMNLNDLLMMGAKAYTLQNHIVLPEDNHKAILKIVNIFISECKKRKIVMTGGETSIHNNIKGMDISVTVSGYISEKFDNKCKEGDVLIGIKSNGLHANGMTMIRKILGDNYRKEYILATKIYVNEVYPLLNKYKINGMMHITGGAWTKLKDISKGMNIYLDFTKKLKVHNIFKEAFDKCKSNEIMYNNFNCGIGYVLSVDKKDAPHILKKIKNSLIIGEVRKSNNKSNKSIHIKSAFDKKEIIL